MIPNPLELTEEQRSSFAAVAATRASRPAPTFMLIDDHLLSVELLKRALAGEHELVTSLRAVEGFHLYLQHAPDILWLDMGLPEVSGLRIAKAICELDPDAYIVVVTANQEGEEGGNARRAGAKGFITKPYSKMLIRQSIEKYLKEHPERRNTGSKAS